jgi:hypothetical protein
MPLLDTRCLTSSSLNPTSTVYYNNCNTGIITGSNIRRNRKIPGFPIDSFILNSGIQEINNIFRETEIEKVLIRILLKIVPDLIEKKVKRILNKDISEKEIE